MFHDGTMENVCMTDALLRKKVNVLKINLLQFLILSCMTQEGMHIMVVVAAEWGH